MRRLLPDEEAIYNGYYTWLVGPNGQPMQLDIYYPNIPLAIEVDGRHHDRFIPRIHKTRERFEYLQACDRAKDQLCKELGIPLVRVKSYMRLSEELMIRLCKKAGVDIPHPHARGESTQ